MISMTILVTLSLLLLFVDQKSQLEAFRAYFRCDSLHNGRSIHSRRPSLAFSNDKIDFKVIYNPFTSSYSQLRSDISSNSESERIRDFLINQLQIMLFLSSSTTADLYFMQNWDDLYSNSEFHDLFRFHHCEDPSKVTAEFDYETAIDPDTFYRLASSCYSNNEMSLSTLPVVYQNGNELLVSLILDNRLYGIVRLYRCPFSGAIDWNSDFRSIDLVVRACQGVLQMLEITKASSDKAKWVEYMNFILSTAQTVRTFTKMLHQRVRGDDKVAHEIIDNIDVQMDALQDNVPITMNRDELIQQRRKVTSDSDTISSRPDVILEGELFSSSKTETLIDLRASDDNLNGDEVLIHEES